MSWDRTHIARLALDKRSAIVRFQLDSGKFQDVQVLKSHSMSQLARKFPDLEPESIVLLDHDGVQIESIFGEVFTGEFAIADIILRAQKLTLSMHTQSLRPHLKAVEVSMQALQGTVVALSSECSRLREENTLLRMENIKLAEAAGDENAIGMLGELNKLIASGRKDGKSTNGAKASKETKKRNVTRS